MEYNPIQTNTMSGKEKLKNLIWHFVNVTLFKYSPSHFSIFRKYRVALLRLFGAKVEWTVSVHPTAKIDYPWNLTMGEKSSIGEKCWIYAMDSIFVGKLSCIGKDVYLLTGSHNINSSTFDLVTKPIFISDGCWISTGGRILPGITLGSYSVVAAGAVVVKDVEPWTVVGGNPAKPIKKRIMQDKK